MSVTKDFTTAVNVKHCNSWHEALNVCSWIMESQDCCSCSLLTATVDRVRVLWNTINYLENPSDLQCHKLASGSAEKTLDSKFHKGEGKYSDRLSGFAC